MSTQLAKAKEKFDTIRNLLEARQLEIAAVLPRHMVSRRMIQVALGALRTNPALLDCTHTSLLSAIMISAQLGLELDGISGQAYLVPYKNRKTGLTECQLQIGYRGMIDLARRSGRIKSISARIVRKCDEFSYCYGLEENLVHVPKYAAADEITHVYAVAKFMEGGFAFEVMTADEIDNIRNGSKNGNGDIWRNFWPEMARKTCIRRLFKYLPISIEISKACLIDEYGEQGIGTNEIKHIISGDGEVFEIVPDSGVVDPEELSRQFEVDEFERSRESK